MKELSLKDIPAKYLTTVNYNRAGMYPGSFGVNALAVFDNGQELQRCGAPCHGFLSSGQFYGHRNSAKIDSKAQLAYIVSSIPINQFNHTADREYIEAFYQFLLDPKNSPWKSILQGEDAGYFKNKEGEYIGLVLPVDAANTPADTVANFLIATRLPFEQRRYFYTWKAALKHGLTPLEATYVASKISTDHQGNSTAAGYNAHYPFGHGLSWNLLRDAAPIESTPKFHTSGSQGYRSPGGIWADRQATNNPFTPLLQQRSAFTGKFGSAAYRAGFLRSDMTFPQGSIQVDDILKETKKRRAEWLPSK